MNNTTRSKLRFEELEERHLLTSIINIAPDTDVENVGNKQLEVETRFHNILTEVTEESDETNSANGIGSNGINGINVANVDAVITKIVAEGEEDHTPIPIPNPDVNRDGFISAIDALLIINELNGGREFPGVYTDVNGNGFTTGEDLLPVISLINKHGSGTQWPIESLPTSGVKLSIEGQNTIEKGETAVFTVNVTNHYPETVSFQISANIPNGAEYLPQQSDERWGEPIINGDDVFIETNFDDMFTLESGETTELEISFRVPESHQGGTVFTTAVIYAHEHRSIDYVSHYATVIDS